LQGYISFGWTERNKVLSAFLYRFDAPSINQSVESFQSSHNCILAVAFATKSFWQHLEFLRSAIFLWFFIYDLRWWSLCERYDFINLKIKLPAPKAKILLRQWKLRFASTRSRWFWQKTSKMNKKSRQYRLHTNKSTSLWAIYRVRYMYMRNFWLNFFFFWCVLWDQMTVAALDARKPKFCFFRFSEFPHTHTLAKHHPFVTPFFHLQTWYPVCLNYSFLFAFFWTNQLFFFFLSLS